MEYESDPVASTSGWDFGEAIRNVKRGSIVRRAGWNGKGMFVYLNLGSHDARESDAEFIGGVRRALFTNGDNGTTTRMPNLNMKAADGSTVTGWLASQTDLLAEDWELAD